MRLRVGLLSVALIGFAAGCDQPRKVQAVSQKSVEPAPKGGLSITQVRSDRLQFDPAKGETAAIRFAINQAAKVELVVYDGRERLVRRVSSDHLSPGEHQLRWDGLDAQARPVPPEAYMFTLIATDTKGGRVVHDMTDVTGGEVLQAQDVRWDRAAGLVRYRLDEPARVNIRFGLPEGGPLLRTLIDWVPRLPGEQAETWDGWDQSKVLRLADHPGLVTSVNAYSLPNNVLLVGERSDRVTFAELPPEPQRQRQAPDRAKRMYFHPDQPLDSRGDITTSLVLAEGATKDEAGRWIVSGKVPVRLDVSNEDRARVLERRFEPVFFVDGIFAFENEGGFLPMTWVWDTTTVNEGEHFISTNVRGYEGNFGTATLRVWVKRAPSDVSRATPAVLGSQRDG